MTEPITDEIRVVSGSSSLGLGFHEDSLNRALALKPHFIGCDGGSSDPGPTYLGRGLSSSPLSAIKRDLRLLVLGGQKNKIPVMIGSCGTAGGAPHLDRVFGALKEIVKEEKLNLKVALIHSEQDKDYLKEKYRAGKIHELGNAPPFDEDVIDRSERIVGCSGAEPFQKALEMGADVVLAGRASDTAIFASFPTLHGFPPGPAWHAAKILECGAASVKQRKTPDCMFAWIRKDHFDVSPLDPDLACSPQSIASHSLYENNDPFEIKENAGTINLTKASYKAIDDRSVRVSGSQFIPAEIHTVKLEGAEFAGYQAITPGSIRDPYILEGYDEWLARLKDKIKIRLDMIYGDSLKEGEDFTLNYKTYGRDGTMGPLEPVKDYNTHEYLMMFEVTAKTQTLANDISEIYHHQALHLPIPKWNGLISGVAFPYSPSYFERGAIYRFNVHHVVETPDPLEMFPIELVELS
jgi:hypothetical protein